MADIIQFPSRKQLTQKQEREMLERHLGLVEDDLRVAMEHLDQMNEEIIQLTLEYTTILKKLKEMILHDED